MGTVHERELFFLDGDAVVGDEVVVGERGPGGHHLRAADHQPGIGFPLHMDEHVGDLLRWPAPVDGRVDDGVVPVQNLLLRLGAPAPRVVRERFLEVSVRAEGAEKRRLVVGAAAHPAVAEAR